MNLSLFNSGEDNFMVSNPSSNTNERSTASANLWDSTSPTLVHSGVNPPVFFNFSQPLVGDFGFLGDMSKHGHSGMALQPGHEAASTSAQGSSPNTTADISFSRTHSCVHKVLQIIQGLHSSAGSGRGPESDGILRANSAALQTLEQILSQSSSCVECMTNSNLDFLLYTAAARMLGWYRAVFSCLSPLATSRKLLSSHSSESVCFFRAVQLSDFDLDSSSERRLNAMLLLFELRKLARFLARVSDERFWGRDGGGVDNGGQPEENSDAASSAGGGNNSSIFRLEQNVLEAFDTFLTASVQDLTQSVDKVCKSELAEG